MKRGKPLQRRTPLAPDPDRVRDWQQRSQDRARTRAREQRPAGPWVTHREPRRNDSRWRAECLEVRGDRCRAPDCPHPWPVQMDHLISRAQGGPSIVENGVPWCEPHHRAKTEHRFRVPRSCLGEDQILWLEREGHARWLPDGTVEGRHHRLFAPTNERERSTS